MARFVATAQGLPYGISITSGPIFEIRSGPTDYPVITDIELTTYGGNSSSNAYVVGFGNPAAAGVARQSWNPISEDGLTTIFSTTLITDWTTPPTVPSKYLRRMTKNSGFATAGGIVLRLNLGAGIQMAPASSLVLWAISVAATANVLETPIISVGMDL